MACLERGLTGRGGLFDRAAEDERALFRPGKFADSGQRLDRGHVAPAYQRHVGASCHGLRDVLGVDVLAGGRYNDMNTGHGGLGVDSVTDLSAKAVGLPTPLGEPKRV